MAVVNDYRGILGNNYWNGATPSGTPAVITYSFSTVSNPELNGFEFPSSFKNSFQRFNSSDRSTARQALDKWSNISGVEFVEVAQGGDILFGKYNISNSPVFDDFVEAFAFYPDQTISIDSFQREPLSGDVFLDVGATNSVYLMMHEIGHSLGFVHPFEGRDTLIYSQDITTRTVLSYNGPPVVNLGVHDIDAARAVYGPVHSSASPLLSWNYDPATDVLEQIWGSAADTILGTNQADRIFGGAGNDYIAGDISDDALFGEIGNDRLIGGDGDDELDGGIGNDVIFGGRGSDGIYGGSGDDNLYGEDGDDALNGHDGDDRLNGGPGSNRVDGGAGNDTLISNIGYNRDTLIGGTGNDTIFGSSSDVADYSGNEVGAVIVDPAVLQGFSLLVHAADGSVDTVQGVNRFTGSDFDDRILTGISIYGRGGDDTLAASTGSNTTFFPHNKRSQLFGEDGNDVLSTTQISAFLSGGAGDDMLSGGQLGDILNGDAGDDLLVGSLSGDVMDGGGGIDTVSYESSGAVSVNLQLGTGAGGHAAGDRLTDVENLIGSAQSDRLLGSANANRIAGGEGDDVIHGLAGDDELIGGEGNDLLRGGSGSNVLFGGAGDDIFVVESSLDRVREYDLEGTDQVHASVSYNLNPHSQHVETLILTGSAEINGTGNGADNTITGNAARNLLIGGLGDDVLNGAAGDDDLLAGAGNDQLSGGAGTDRHIGGLGDDLYRVDVSGDRVVEFTGQGEDTVVSTADTFSLLAQSNNLERLLLGGTEAIDGNGNHANNFIAGNNADNVLNAGRGNDTIIGNGGDDTINGGAGIDIINGGTGNDTMNGGNDADTFVFNGAYGNDTIFGFSVTGGDVIDLSAVAPITDFADLQANHLSQTGSSAVITTAFGTITIFNVGQAFLSDGDFVF